MVTNERRRLVGVPERTAQSDVSTAYRAWTEALQTSLIRSEQLRAALRRQTGEGTDSLREQVELQLQILRDWSTRWHKEHVEALHLLDRRPPGEPLH